MGNIAKVSQKGEKKLFHRIMKVVFGDILEYEYEHNNRISMSSSTFFIRQKWSILSHLFLIVALITFLSLEYLLLLALALWCLTFEENEDS